MPAIMEVAWLIMDIVVPLARVLMPLMLFGDICSGVDFRDSLLGIPLLFLDPAGHRAFMLKVASFVDDRTS